MARPVIEGLEYANIDIDFFDDIKILFVSDKFAEKGELITIKLLLWIYKQGYYTQWNEEIAMLFAKKNFRNVSFELVDNVVKELIKRGFFTESIFNSFGVLTSHGIQKRWQRVITGAKRKCAIKQEYCLLLPQKMEETTAKRELMPPEGALMPPEVVVTQQSKVKYSIVKESKESKEESIAPSFEKNDSVVLKTENEEKEKSCAKKENPLINSNLFRQPKIPSMQEVREFFIGAGGTEDMAKKFFDSHSGVGWFNRGSPITNFRNFVPGYISSWRLNEKKSNANTISENTRKFGRKGAGFGILNDAIAEFERRTPSAN